MYDDAGAGRRCGELVVDAVDRFPVVHRVDEDLPCEQIAWQLAKAVRRDGEHDPVGVMDDRVGVRGSSAGGEDVHDQRDSFGRSRP